MAKDMETVVVTGANRGIGLELGKRYLESGHRVIAGCRNPAAAAELKALTTSGDLTTLSLDVLSHHSMERFAADIGSLGVDILINNAGVMGGDRQSVDDIDYQAWLETFQVNTLAPMKVATLLKRNLMQSASPRVVTVSSQMGALSRKSRGSFAYRSSKAAVNKVMQVLALEWEADGIVCCPVHPGWVRTDMGGGPGADISVAESASGIIDLVARLTSADSGQFFSWDGSVHAW